MKRYPRILIRAATAAALLVLLVVVGINLRQAPEAEAVPEVPLVAVSVTHPVTDTVFQAARYLGTVEGAHDALLAFRVGSTIARIHVQEGQSVAAGQLLAELALPEAAARVERARMELARAEATLLHWERERGIDKRLYEQGAVSRSKLDQSHLAYETALRARDAARAGVDEVVSLAAASELRAPQHGVVGRIDRAAGEMVMPGQPVLLLSAGPHRVQADVLEKDRAHGIREGSTALLSTTTCTETRGQVVRVDVAVRPPFQSVRVYLSFPETCLAGLPSGAVVAVTFPLQRDTEATLVPISAIDLRSGAPRVFRVGPDQKAEAVPVELGLQQGEWQQVLGSLAPNDLIVISGTTNLKPGALVQVAQPPAREEPLAGGAL